MNSRARLRREIDFLAFPVMVRAMNEPLAAAHAPSRFTVSLEEGDFAGWRWRRDGAAPLLFCHATGFCASAYKQMLGSIAGRFDIYALDMRGHGRTRLPADPARLRSWDVYAGDVAAFLDREQREGWTLAGHSMGGVVVTLAARGRRDVAAIRLIEPVAPSPLYAWIAGTPVWSLIARRTPLVRRAKGRRARWPGREEVVGSYARKPLFRGWAPGALGDYLEDGLVTDDDGVRLACDPAWEAATFAAQANPFWAAVRAASAPLSVFAAAHGSSTVWPAGRGRLRRMGVEVVEIPGVTHLAPMEKPDFAGEFLAGRDISGARV